MGSVEPTHQRFLAFQAGADSPGPVVMINLLRYRDQANYAADFDAEPCSGKEAWRRYSDQAFRCVEAAGGRVVFWGRVQASVIAPDGEEWDEAFLVEYPSRAAMLKMLSQPDYRAIIPHRTAALADSRLIATQPRNPKRYGSHARSGRAGRPIGMPCNLRHSRTFRYGVKPGADRPTVSRLCQLSRTAAARGNSGHSCRTTSTVAANERIGLRFGKSETNSIR